MGIDLMNRRVEREYVWVERTARQKPEKWGEGYQYALMSGDWKYVHATHGDDQLFDMRRDRGETVNVIADYPEVSERMLALVLRRVADYSAHQNPDELLDERSEKALEELRSLGYVQ